MREAVIVEAVRTPIGRHGGVLKDVRPDDLAALVIAEVVKRAGVDPALVEEVYFGCANQAGEDNRNVARMGSLLAGLPVSVAAVTFNRLCASSLAAINAAARAIKAGEGDVYVAGGVESMTRSPYVIPKTSPEWAFRNVTAWDTTIGWRFPNQKLKDLYGNDSMGETAENVYDLTKTITREEQDRFALVSHQRAVEAITSGKFAEEIVPVPVAQKKGDPMLISRDEHPRADTSLESLAKLRPAFRQGGTVTAGNSSGINDGAAALLIMSADKAHELGKQPLARIVTSAAAGVEPRTMGIGPVPATRKALERAGLKLEEIGLIELNEAFAVQALAVMKELGLRHEITNVNGGAIALGHPLGCSGARLMCTLVHEMRRRAPNEPRPYYGLATLCVGVGLGEATIVEWVDG
ncbi:MAG: acetyl-CoA C-acyltransferase [Proteobacteria bacterium]|nr:acetyl-CoA C-acyltransferase [Pseudomonadota bacterium]MBU4582999.1 acetyl-CoA C-acyltransferase [Pseudomonadota bacterium]